MMAYQEVLEDLEEVQHSMDLVDRESLDRATMAAQRSQLLTMAQVEVEVLVLLVATAQRLLAVMAATVWLM
jgi:hypothetical protein